MAEICRTDITGLVLSGGRGARMGGVDKGLQLFNKVPLALHAAQRLQTQTSAVLISANRELATYKSWGYPVLPDTLPQHPGPLAGVLAGLTHLNTHPSTKWLATCPCDCPSFPLDLVQSLARHAHEHACLAVCAQQRSPEGLNKDEPTFCLLHRQLAPSLHAYLASGERKVMAWLRSVGCAGVMFDRAIDAGAFDNLNTLEDLAQHQTHKRI